jgi:hypothetical protein
MVATPTPGAHQPLRSIQDVASRLRSLHAAGRDGAALRRIYQVGGSRAAGLDAHAINSACKVS